MYKDYFGFNDSPFSIAPDPRYLYLSEQHKDALAHLLYGVGDQGGFVLLTGEVGTGKTTICRCLLQQIPENCEVAYVVNPKQSEVELLRSICDELGVYYFYEGQGSAHLVDLINEHLLALHAKGKNCVVIVDEAQNLSVEVLEQLRLLTNLETDQKKLLQLILLGQPELNELLGRDDLRQLAQRITARFHLRALSCEEAEHYIRHRLSVAGYRGELFTKEAIKRIHKESQGIPRLMNVICDRCLLGCFSHNTNLVDLDIVKQAVIEIRGNAGRSKSGLGASVGADKKWWAIIGLLLLLFASLAYHFWSEPSANQGDSLGVNAQAAETEAARSLSQNTLAESSHNRAALFRQLIQAQSSDLPQSVALSGSEQDAASEQLFCQQLRDISWQCREYHSVGQINSQINSQANSQASSSTASELDYRIFSGLRTSVLAKLQRRNGGTQWYLVSNAQGIAGQESDSAYTIVDRHGVQQVVSASALREQLTVPFTWLWQEPPAYRDALSLGESDEFVQWLSEQLPDMRAVSDIAAASTNTKLSYMLLNKRPRSQQAIVDTLMLRRISALSRQFGLSGRALTPELLQILKMSDKQGRQQKMTVDSKRVGRRGVGV